MIPAKELKRLKSLKQKKYRYRYSQFLIEGKRLIDEAVTSQANVIQAWYHTDYDYPDKVLLDKLDQKQIPHEEVTKNEINILSDTVHNQGIVALVKFPEQKQLTDNSNQNWIYLDNVSDPGNLGTILRTADWFGIRNIGFSHNCVDPYNPKVVRGGMGAHFHISIHTEVDLNDIKAMGHTILAADQSGTSLSKCNASSITKWCLVLGSETHGISEEITPLIDHFVAIPGTGKAESLNIAVAGGILMFLLK